jgi:aminoglycoside phosphotransferase (APT) family kinase protein
MSTEAETSSTLIDDALNLIALRAYLDQRRPGFVHGELRATLLAGGHSNLTFSVGDGGHRWVLRRPPLGEHAPAAHDMFREYRVMRALRETPIPVPEMLHYCDDRAVIGAPFFLSEYVPGIVYRDVSDTAVLGAGRARAISRELIDVLARLHTIDPQAVGLADLGRPAGFLDRQVRRWTENAARVIGSYRGAPELVELLRARMPQTAVHSIVHGDYRLDNVLVSADDRVAAVLDWEMATLGDPLTDLGLLWCYWAGLPRNEADTMRKGISPELGFPDIRELAAHYSAATGWDVSALPWYVAFGYFKLAALRGQIHQRYLNGQTPGEGFETVGQLIAPLIDESLRTLEQA